MSTITINGVVTQIREGSTKNGSNWDIGGDAPQNACFIRFPSDILPTAKVKEATINWRIPSYDYRAAIPMYVQACGKYTSTLNGVNQPALIGIKDETQIASSYTGNVALKATNAITSAVSANLDALYVKVYTKNGKNRKHMTNSPSLTVTYVEPPVITGNVANKTVTLGSSVTFTCSSTGATSRKWYKNGTQVSTATSYTFTPTKSDNNATIYCEVINEAGTARSNNAKLTVKYAPTNVTIPETDIGYGEVKTIKATYTNGNPPISGVFTWRVDGTLVSETSNPITIDYDDYDTGEHTISVTIENEVGTATGSSTFNITSRPPSITLGDVTVKENTSHKFTAGGDVGVPKATLLWTKNGAEQIEGDSATYRFTRQDNGATIKCYAENIAGSSEAEAEVTVTWDAEILVQPTNKVFSGSPVTFIVTATGSPYPSFQWYKDGSPMAGETGNALTVGAEFSSKFFCRVFNDGASVDSVNVGVIPNAGTARKPKKKYAFYMRGNKLYSPYYYDNGAKEFEK